MLWEGRYKASIVQDDFYLLTCQRYIELNPVRAGMVTTPGDYRYSSYRRNAMGKADKLVTEHATYTALADTKSGRENAYQYLFHSEIRPELVALLRAETSACRPIGDDAFMDRIETMTDRNVRRGKVGRPPKKR